jgi:hypothetical protein
MKKTYILMIAKNFLATHPRKGQPTTFKEKILAKEKIHTIRHNYAHWEKIAKEVNAGTAILVLKEWTGRPYHSKQSEIMRLEKIGLQSVIFGFYNYVDCNVNDDSQLLVMGQKLAENDGLTVEDFKAWFGKPDPKEKFAIIHFTDFTYKF